MTHKLQPSGSRLSYPTKPIKIIGITGVTGRLGSAVFASLVPLARRHSCKLVLLAYDDLSFARQVLMTHDALAGDIATVMSLEVQNYVDALIVCSGVRTSKTNKLHKKDALLAANREILDSVLDRVTFGVCLLATNPSTAMALHIQQKHRAPVLGVGVQNDNVRFEAMNRHGRTQVALVGAHNFAELVLVSLSPSADPQIEPDDRKSVKYRAVAEAQDDLLDHANYRGLLAQLSELPPDVAWWASQRANTMLNDTTLSAANVIVQLLESLLAGRCSSELPPVIEMELSLEGRHVVLGWPFDFLTMAPLPVYTTENGVRLILEIADKYKLS